VALGAAGCSPVSRPAEGARPGRDAGGTTEPAGVADPALPEYIGDPGPGSSIDFTIVLRRPGERALQRFLDRVGDPASPQYREFIDAATIGRRFGLSNATLERVRSELETGGFEVLTIYPQRTSMAVRGSAPEIDAFFGVRMGTFEATDGRRYVAPLGDPVIPASLQRWVVGLAGLNGAPFPTLTGQAIPNAEGLLPEDAARAYNVDELHAQGLLGQNQTIAIVSFASFRVRDVELFDAEVQSRQETPHEPPPVRQSVESVPVLGGNPDRTGEVAQEVNLDIDVVRGAAPQAKILNYEAPLTSFQSFINGMIATIDQIVEEGRADIVSISYGMCDTTELVNGQPMLSDADRAAADAAFESARAAGVSVFIASGDTGAFGCQRFLLDDTRAIPLWPGDDDDIVSVGGTLLSVRENGEYLEEAGWEDIFTGSGTGGGLNSRQEALPEFQAQFQLPDVNPDGVRQVPDVAAAADPNSGFFVAFPDAETGDTVVGAVGGTSASTPFWSATMLLIRQKAEQEGVGRLGFANDLLYAVAQRSQDYGDPNRDDEPFRDVLIGGNRLHDCAPGYDLATGLGSPNAGVLADEIVALLGEQ
jgi:kumamolisin